MLTAIARHAALVVFACTGLAANAFASPPSGAAAKSGVCGVAPDAPVPNEMRSPETVPAALYEIVSGNAGTARSWDKLRALHAPNARFVVTNHTPDAGFAATPMNIDEFIALNERLFANRGFFERELARKVERIGHIAHVWSSYDSREAPDQTPYAFGTNSIQLVSDGARWCVLNVTWDFEVLRGNQLHSEGATSSSWTQAVPAAATRR